MTDTVSRSLWNAFPDSDDPVNNETVSVADCSGFLVTSTLVLTAGHCLKGVKWPPNGTEGYVGQGTPVFFGANAPTGEGGAWTAVRLVEQAWTPIKGDPTKLDVLMLSGSDVALLLLDHPVVTEAYGQKPRLIPPIGLFGKAKLPISSRRTRRRACRRRVSSSTASTGVWPRPIRRWTLARSP